MSRNEMHIDGMLRHLGAAYYDSLHGRASTADVTRALDQVAQRVGEKPQPRPAARPHTDRTHRATRHHGRLHSRVRDVMTSDVVTVDRITPFKEIADLLVAHQVSGLPVLGLGRKVVGVVTEDDLISARDTRVGARRRWTGLLRYGSDYARYQRLTAEQLMTAPPVTIHPDASIAAAARLMSRQHIKRLPVIDPEGVLLGIVSRRDLLNVFCIPDPEIARQVREVLAEALPGESESIKVAVHGGIVTLTCDVGTHARQNGLARAIVIAWDLDGVVDIISHVATAQMV